MVICNSDCVLCKREKVASLKKAQKRLAQCAVSSYQKHEL